MTKRILTLLEKANRSLPKALSNYEEFVNTDGFSFSHKNTLEASPDKTYSARAQVAINYKDKVAGTMWAIMFGRGDGTGNETHYNQNEISIPVHFDHAVPSWKRNGLIPRKKEGVVEEYFFPFFTVYNGEIYPNTAHLDELTLRENGDERLTVCEGATLGAHLQDFTSHLNLSRKATPKIQYTVGNKGEKRIGDPHAVVSSLLFPLEVTQVVGFLSITDKDDPLREILSGKTQWPIWKI